MKIGLVIDDSLDRNDGVQQYVRTLGKWLADNKHEVHYLSGQTASDNRFVHSLSKNVTVKFNGNRLTVPWRVSSSHLRRLLNQELYDILHIQMPYSPFMAGKVIKYAPRRTAIVGTFHVMPYEFVQVAATYILGKLQKHSLSKYDAACAVSPAAKIFADENYMTVPLVIPNAVDLKIWQSNSKPVPGRIVFLGRLVPRKGCRQLLLALSKLPASERNKLQIIIGGDGPQKSALKQLAAKLSVNAEFIGYVNEQDKLALLASADIAVFPSLGGESFGIILLEAMAAGAGLVIGGDNAGYRGVLQDTPECLINFKSPELAADELIRLLKNPLDRKKIHVLQRQTIKKYDISLVGTQILAMYETAMLHHRQEMR